MALGAAVAAAAAITRSEIALIIIGGVYVIETLSVILQIISCRLLKRIFRRLPFTIIMNLKGGQKESG